MYQHSKCFVLILDPENWYLVYFWSTHHKKHFFEKLYTSWSDCNWTRTQNHLVLKWTLNHFRVRLSPVVVTSPSDFTPASSKEFLDIQATIECGFTLKRVCDRIRTYSYILHYFIFSKIIWFKYNWKKLSFYLYFLIMLPPFHKFNSCYSIAASFHDTIVTSCIVK